jgi:hypothetical protein
MSGPERRVVRRSGLRARVSHCTMSRNHSYSSNGSLTNLSGAERYVRRDWVGAAHAWRPISQSETYLESPTRHAFAEAFDRSGDSDLADRVDAPMLAHRGPSMALTSPSSERQGVRARMAIDRAPLSLLGKSLTRGARSRASSAFVR